MLLTVYYTKTSVLKMIRKPEEGALNWCTAVVFAGDRDDSGYSILNGLGLMDLL
jgi:hypothetical protein